MYIWTMLDRVLYAYRKEEEMEEISKMFHEAIATYKKLLVESSYNAMSTASMTAQPTVDPASSNYGAQSYTTTDSSNQYMPPSYVPPSVYGQPSELPSMSARYSPELSRAQFPATGLQHQQPLPQAPPPPVSSTSVLLQPPAYQVSHVAHVELSVISICLHRHLPKCICLQELSSK